jgi:hypothetical protein
VRREEKKGKERERERERERGRRKKERMEWGEELMTENFNKYSKLINY